MQLLRKIYSPVFTYNWKFGLFLVLLFGVPRFILVLQANVAGGYSQAFIIFFLMWFAPFIFLTREGRREIGVKRSGKYLGLLYSFVLGILSCSLIFLLFYSLYDYSLSNAFVYISGSGSMPDDIPGPDKFMYFIIAAIPSMLFSPIGEEFLYRGVIHGSFVADFGDVKASYLDSLAFAVTHLAHFGIIYHAGKWEFLPLPALLWVLSMFLVSRLFFRCKQMCDSVYGAILSHAGYNLAMMYFIFYHLH